MPTKTTGAKRATTRGGDPTPARGKRPTAAERAAAAEAALVKVRTALDAALMRYAERVGGELDRVRRDLTQAEPPAVKVLDRVIQRLDEVKLKPAKGRVKDLARLEDLAEDLADLVPPDSSAAGG
jgi:hypothetical protein